MSFCSFASSCACLQRLLHVALAASRLVVLQLLLRLPELVERRLRLRAAVLRSVRRGLPHRVRRFLQLARGILQVLPLLLARQLLEPARRLFELLRELTLRVAAAAARLALACGRETALTLGFLLLPPRELLQLLGELVDLLVAALLLGALLHLVLVGELVHLQLEEIGEILRHLLARRRHRRRRRAACETWTSYSCSASCSSFSARCSGESASLACWPFRFDSAVFISAAAFGSASAIVLNAGSTASSRLFILPLSSSTCSRSFACASVRNTVFSRNFSGGHLRLVAHGVERRRDDLALLLRELTDLVAAAAAAAAARPSTAPACSPCGTA